MLRKRVASSHDSSTSRGHGVSSSQHHDPNQMFQNTKSFDTVRRGLCAFVIISVLVGLGFVSRQIDEPVDKGMNLVDVPQKVPMALHGFRQPKIDPLTVNLNVENSSPDDEHNNIKDRFHHGVGGNNHANIDSADSDAQRKDSSKHAIHADNVPQSDENEDIHIIFSTDCSAFQHWQSYLLFYSAYRIKQPGKITRIASGCSDEAEKGELEWHRTHISSKMSENFYIHFTPHFSAVKGEDGKVKGDYKFFNKPMGLQHWLQYGEGMGINEETGSPMNEDTVIALLDPDMILLKHITSDFSNEKMILVSKIAKDGQKFKVEHGSPFGQHYGLGTQWQTFGLDVITSDSNSNAKAVSRQEAAKHYPVGPPYMATARDMYKIAQKWVEFVPRVHAEYPYLLAEMYAYCIAAAHLNLPHQLVDHMMVSNTGAGGEGWYFVDNLKKNARSETVCEVMNNESIENLHFPESTIPLPTVIHFCQRYIIGNSFFGKRKVPTDFFTCEHPLLQVPPNDLDALDFKLSTDHKTKNEEQKLRIGQNVREAFVICTSTRIMNEAAEYFKQNGCSDVQRKNLEKSLNMHDHF